MADFSKALDYLFANEGGFSNHSQDRGGATKYGITKRTYSEYRGQQVTDGDVFSMPMDIAEKVYKKLYWDALMLDKVDSQAVATALFDQAVNRGVGAMLRNIYKLLGISAGISIGNKTIEAINKEDPSELVKQISDNALEAYNDIISKNPSQEVFRKGWEARANRILTLIV